MDASKPPGGFKKGLTQYGDSGFSLFLRKAFIKGAGYTDDALDRPVIGIASTGSAYNPCHGNMPQLLEAVQRGITGGADGYITKPFEVDVLMAAVKVVLGMP